MSDAPMNDSLPVSIPVASSHSTVSLLKKAREARGLDIAILASAMKVPVKKLEALEEGRYDELPGLTFARALASSACRHLKIDAESILAQIPVADKPLLGSTDMAIDAPFTRSLQSRFQPSLLLSRTALLSALVLVVAALLVAFWPANVSWNQLLPSALVQPHIEPPAVSAPTSRSAIPVPETPVEVVSIPVPTTLQPATPVTQTPLEATLVPTTQSAATAVPPQLPTTVVASTPPANSPVGVEKPVSKSGSVMTIRAVSNSWVEVTNSSGKALYRGTVEAGDSVNFVSAPPYSVLLGRMEAVEVTVRGQSFDPTPFARNSVARFEVK